MLMAKRSDKMSNRLSWIIAAKIRGKKLKAERLGLNAGFLVV
jgi:hypothetical protein